LGLEKRVYREGYRQVEEIFSEDFLKRDFFPRGGVAMYSGNYVNLIEPKREEEMLFSNSFKTHPWDPPQ
jgi:hypothetical protein